MISLMTPITALVIVIVLLTLLVGYLLFCIIYIKVKNDDKQLVKEKEINSLNRQIHEYKEVNKFLSSIINKYKQQIGGTEVEKTVKKEKEFDLDEILAEISKIGIKYLHPDKIEFLKKFKKK